ncbi:G-type lectin S-receptor-like serine/threonine-protein kinase [Tanacetum coccineum]|uniref:G-type lectin S-receptor-like serine/threonine-protein kinase n=1 Tax=Tanacetum coccineum TaxID=301880 RepID=A0ABQ5G2M5_9ASTR
MGDFCLNDTILGSILWESFNYPDRPPQAKVWYDSKPYWRGGPWDGGRFIASDKFQVLKGLKLPDRYHYFPDKNPDECQNWCMGNCSCTAYAFVTTIYCMAWTEDLIDIQQFAFGGENLYLRLSYAEIDVEIVSRDTLQEDVHESFELPIYEFKPIIAATDNFSYRNKLCEGGFDPFYKGILDHGQQVAVKRLSGDSGQGIEEKRRSEERKKKKGEERKEREGREGGKERKGRKGGGRKDKGKKKNTKERKEERRRREKTGKKKEE